MRLTPEQAGEIDRVNRSLTNQTPGPITIERIEAVRGHARELAAVIITRCESSRERALALTHLEETVMWAVKSLVLYNLEDQG